MPEVKDAIENVNKNGHLWSCEIYCFLYINVINHASKNNKKCLKTKHIVGFVKDFKRLAI